MIEMRITRHSAAEKEDIKDVTVWEESKDSSYYKNKKDTQCHSQAASAEDILYSLGLDLQVVVSNPVGCSIKAWYALSHVIISSWSSFGFLR